MASVQQGGLFGAQPQQQGGGGLFGAQPQQQQGGGLFGAQPQQQQGGGLFGAQPQQQQGGGLFGAQPQQQQGGGLFGAQPQQQQQGGGLFGAQPQQQQGGGGLFGSQPQQQQQGGGLFGTQPQQKQQAGGLFGAQPQQGGGLFGTQPQQQGGGLFGTQPQQGGGLFGSQPQQGGGLFGSQPQQPQQQAGGLFGAQPQQPQQQQGKSKIVFSGDGTCYPGYSLDEYTKFYDHLKKVETLKTYPNVQDDVKRLFEITLLYNPLYNGCRFKCISYCNFNGPNTTEDEIKKHSRRMCGQIDEKEWEMAWTYARKINRVPIVYRGLRALCYRCEEVNESAKALKTLIEPYKTKLDTAQRKSTILSKKIVYLRNTQAQLEARLARVIGGVSMPMGKPQNDAENEDYARLTAKLELLKAKVCDHQLYEGKIRDLELRSRNVTARYPTTSSFVRSADVSMSREDLATLRVHLMAQQDSIIKLSEAVTRCQSNIPTLK